LREVLLISTPARSSQCDPGKLVSVLSVVRRNTAHAGHQISFRALQQGAESTSGLVGGGVSI